MADDGKFIIPKFKDKVVYYSSNNIETSYPVASSYKGILRLSPNDDTSLAEANTEEIIGSNLDAGNYYLDPIHEFIDKQFIRVSTSDGYLLDLRMTQYQVEFDNLYIRGPIKGDIWRLYTNSDESLSIDGHTFLPTKVNDSTAALVSGTNNIKTDITDTSESYQPYILVNHDDKKRKFTYEQFNALVEEVIMETLMDVCSLPTGSMWFFPITIQEYKKLLVTEGYRPNEYFKNGDKSKPTPTIIRDFLLCDGSLYYNEDFPELAKVLQGEQVPYWRYDSSKNMMVLDKSWKNTYEGDKKENKIFRVPDLRHQFLKSVYVDIKTAMEDWNQTGNWNVDVRPKLAEGKIADNHVHFICSGFYTGSYKTNNFAPVVDDEMKLTNYVSVLAPTSKDIFWGGGHMCNHGPGQGGWRCPTKMNGFVWGIGGTCSYTLATPYKYNYQSNNIIADTGLSSLNISSAVEDPQNNAQLDYNDRDEYVSLLDDNENLYGMENVPEHYCALPLIKI